MIDSFHIFARHDFGELRDTLIEELRKKIYSEDANYVLNVNESEYLDHIFAEFELDPLELHFDDKTVSSYERNIPANCFLPVSLSEKGNRIPNG